MDRVSLPAEASTEDNEAEDKPHQIWPMFSQQTEIFEQQDDDTFTYASSIYSDQQASNNFERCCSPSSSTSIRNTQNHPDPALPYLAIVTELRAVVYPSRLDKESHDAKDVRSTSAKRSSTSSSSRCKHHQHTEQQSTTSKTRLDSTPATKHDTFKPVMHTALHSRISSKLKAIRFQDTADNFTAPSLDPNLAKHTQPLRVEKNSIMIERWPREPRAALSLRGSGSSRNKLASSPGSALIDERDRSGVGISGKEASMREEDGAQAYHPLTNVPVKKGWVRKIASALMERGEQS